jgi:hypothetical protein
MRYGLVPVKNAIYWLWRKMWAWGPLAWIVGTICISVGIVVAPERMYVLGRTLVTVGGCLLSAKVLHDAVAEHKPVREIVAAFLISGVIILAVTIGGWWIIKKIEWNHEVVIKVTFKSSPLFTEKRQRDIVWNLNEYYVYLKKVGFDLPVEIPPLGLSPPHSAMLSGGSQGPAYYSHLIITEDTVDNPNILRSVYSTYTFNRMLVWPDAYKTGLSRTEAKDDEVAVWIFSCYFPASFSGRKACADEAPGHNWTEAIWEVRSKYGQDYTDGLMCYTVTMWGVPAKYADSFDKFFRYRLAGGESVKDNGQRGPEIDVRFKRHGLDITPPL